MARETREGGRLSEALLDELLAGQDPPEVFRYGSLIDDLKKAVAERALDGDGCASGGRANAGQPPQRAQPQARTEVAVPAR